MKAFIILVVAYAFWIGWLVGRENPREETDLEIYTKDNIYYINGLTVTNEVDGGEKRFKNKEQLKEYISNLTAKENEDNRK